MIVEAEQATQWLSNVSYYRLSAYWYPARITGRDGHPTDQFSPGTTFSDAVHLYEADRKLRTLVHDGMERVEVALRTRVGESLCVGDPLRYSDPGTFRENFDHAGWMSIAERRVHRAGRHNEAIKHYRKRYGGSFPFWVLAEVLDFSDLSRLFEGLHSRDQLGIAESLDIKVDLTLLSKNQQSKAKKSHPLVRWLEHLTVIRNTCAHHGRLWNKSFTPAPTAALLTQPDFFDLPEGQSERLFGALIMMSHLLRTISPGTTWPEKVSSLINELLLPNPLAQPENLGIARSWKGAL